MVFLKYYKSTIIFILVLLLSLLPANSTAKIHFLNLPYFDKVIHFLMYFSLTFVLFLDIKIKIKNPTRPFIFRVVILLVVWSGFLEIIQEFFILGRSGSWFDLLANILGVIFGTFLFYRISKFVKTHQDY